MWYVIWPIIHLPHLTFKQDDELVGQLDRMEINMQDAFLMLQALCEVEGIDVASITNETHVPSDTPSAWPSELEGSDHDEDV
jgi:hypothetical protein